MKKKAEKTSRERLKQSQGRSKEITRIHALIKHLTSVQQEIEKEEERLGTLKKQLLSIRRDELPQAMTLAGVTAVKTPEGLQVEKIEGVDIRIPKGAEARAYSWLRKNKLGDLIKNVIQINFATGEDKAALALGKELKAQGYTYDQTLSVHTGTLKAWARERRAAGEPIPEDVFKVYDYTDVRIKQEK